MVATHRGVRLPLTRQSDQDCSNAPELPSRLDSIGISTASTENTLLASIPILLAGAALGAAVPGGPLSTEGPHGANNSAI